MKTIEVKTAELEGAALDWAVAKAEGHEPLVVPTGRAEYSVGVILAMDDGPKGFACRYSTEWSQLGPLIEKHAIVIGNHPSGDEDRPGEFWGSAHCFVGGTSFDTWKGIKVAACRAIVAAKLGGTVRVPADLVEVKP